MVKLGVAAGLRIAAHRHAFAGLGIALVFLRLRLGFRARLARLGILDEETTRLNHLVGDLLRYARPIPLERHLVSLRDLVDARLATACGNRIKARIVWEPSNSNVFVTKPGPFTDLAVAAIEEVTGRKPELSTSGGTSDARFISSYCPVIEFGLVGQTMHQVDERTPVADLEKLTKIYRGVLDRYFA